MIEHLPNLEGGFNLSIHVEDVGSIRIHVQDLVGVPEFDEHIIAYSIQN